MATEHTQHIPNSEFMGSVVSIERVMHSATQSIEAATPWLLVRVGDGELSLIDHNNPRLLSFSRVHLGYVPTDQVLSQLRANLIQTVSCSDFVGVCTQADAPGVLWPCAYDIMRRDIPSFADKMSGKQLCDMNIHCNINGPRNIHLLAKCVCAARKLVLITSRDVVDEVCTYFKLSRDMVEFLQIPGESKYEEIQSKSTLIWDVHSRITSCIHAEKRHGQLCLFGTGMAAKDLGMEFKNAGGVAFDLGSVFDAWYGKITRGKGKGKDAYSSKYLSTLSEPVLFTKQEAV